MRKFTLFALAAAIMTSVCQAQSTPQNEPILLESIRVFDVHSGTFSSPLNIMVEGEKISYVAIVFDAPSDCRAIDCRGKFAVPGLFECHAHLTGLTKLGDDSVKSTLEEFVSRGIMGLRDVGGPIDIIAGMSKRITSREITGPEIFYTGPMLEKSPLMWEVMNDDFPGFTVPINSAGDVDSILPALASQGAALIKTFNKMDSATYAHLVDVARQHSLRIVHDPGTPLFNWIPMDMAIDLGVTSIEHAKAPWPVVLADSLRQEHDKLIGPDADQMACQAFMTEVSQMGVASVSIERLKWLSEKMKANNVYLCPTLNVLSTMEEGVIASMKKNMNLEELPPPMLMMIKRAIAGMEDVSRFFVGEFARDSVKMLVGQDGHDPAGTFAEMQLMKNCGVSEAEIIKGATIYPAEWLGINDRLGSIAPGKQANILVVDTNPLENIANLESASIVIYKGQLISE